MPDDALCLRILLPVPAEGDEEVAEGLHQLAGEVQRLGANLNQIARACNEARQRGERLPYTAEAHAQTRAAVELVWTVVGQVNQMAGGRRGQLDAAVAAALRGRGLDEPA